MSLSQYIKETRVELKHVAWPTQMQTIVYTALVVGVSILVALYVGFFDFLFTRGLEEIIGNAPSSVNTAPVQTPEGLDFDVMPGAQTGTENMPVITNEPAPKGGSAPEVQ